MIYDYLQRGVLAGVVAGLAYGLYMMLVGNPLSEYAHDAGHEHGHGTHDHGHAVSEVTTAVVSAGSGILWVIFLGGLFAIGLYIFEPALPGTGGTKSYVLAGAGFLTVSAMPWLALPPAAPGAEQLYTVTIRLALYAGLVAVGAIVSAIAIIVYNRTAPHHRALGLGAACVPIAGAAVGISVLTPTVVTHPGLSSDLVSAYQALAVLSQAAIWVLLASTFNWLSRRTSPSPTAADSTETATRRPTR